MRVGVLAVQGAFAEHMVKLGSMGNETFGIRQLRDIERDFDGLVIPGGESTVMRKLTKELGLFEPLKQLIKNGMPVLGTCAGMIMLAEKIEGGEEIAFGTMSMTVKRNAYGRQLGSFRCRDYFAGKEIEMPFIRAPYVSGVGDGAEVLSVHEGKITAVRQDNQLSCAFHPELTDDNTVFDIFVNMMKQR